MVVDVVGQVRRLKSENGLSLKAEVSMLEIYSIEQASLDKVKGQEAVISGIAKAKAITYICGDTSNFAIDKSDDLLVIRVNI